MSVLIVALALHRFMRPVRVLSVTAVSSTGGEFSLSCFVTFCLLSKAVLLLLFLGIITLFIYLQLV